MASVTIVGSGNQQTVLSFDATTNFALAQQVAGLINASVAAGTTVITSDVNGAPPTLPGGVSGAYTQSSAKDVVLPAGYIADAVNVTGSAVVFGSGATGQEILSGQTTDLTFTASSGSGTVVAGGSNNRLLASGPGNWSLNTGSGNDAIIATGSGNDSIAAGGGRNAIVLGSGNDFIVSAGNDRIQAGTGAASIDATGATSDFVQGNQSDLYFVGGVGGATIIGGSGSDTYFGSASATGKQVIEGGLAGNNFLWANSGAATLTGGGNNDQLIGGGNDRQVLTAGAGNETLSAFASSGNNVLTAGSGNDQLFGGSGADTFMGGTGNATVTAGSTSDVFAFVKGHVSNEVVQDITDPASVKISLQGFGSVEAATALANQIKSPAGVTIALSDGTKVTFLNVTDLHGSNFV